MRLLFAILVSVAVAAPPRPIAVVPPGGGNAPPKPPQNAPLDPAKDCPNATNTMVQNACCRNNPSYSYCKGLGGNQCGEGMFPHSPFLANGTQVKPPICCPAHQVPYDPGGNTPGGQVCCRVGQADCPKPPPAGSSGGLTATIIAILGTAGVGIAIKKTALPVALLACYDHVTFWCTNRFSTNGTLLNECLKGGYTDCLYGSSEFAF